MRSSRRATATACAPPSAGRDRKGDAEVHAWALMGISDMVAATLRAVDQKAPLKRVADAAFELIAEGLDPDRGR